MDKAAIAKLEPTGPSNTELTRLELDPEDFQSNLPEQHWHIYFEDAQLGLTVGVRTTTSMQEAFGPYPGDEFMILLEGQVALLDSEDRQTVVKQGETFTVRNGLPVSWKQEGFCRKFFMTYQPSETPATKDIGSGGGVNILKTAELEPKLQNAGFHEQGLIAADKQVPKEATCFINDTGNMRAGLMQTGAFETKIAPVSGHSLVQLLTGNIQITEADGQVHDFGAGDVFFLPAGTQCAWRTSAPVSLYFCKVDPAG